MVASKVFIARHGERIDHVDPLWKTRVENPDDPFLTERGLAQAHCLGQRLAVEGIVKIFVSPFYRTIQTAAAVAKAANVTMCIEPGICEGLLPEWFPKGSPRLREVADLAEEFPTLDPAYVPVHVPDYPETKPTTIERVKMATKKLVQNEEGPILLVGHGISCEGAARGLLGDKPIAYIDYCALIQLDKTAASGSDSGSYSWAGTGGPDVTYIQDRAIRYVASSFALSDTSLISIGQNSDVFGFLSICILCSDQAVETHHDLRAKPHTYLMRRRRSRKGRLGSPCFTPLSSRRQRSALFIEQIRFSTRPKP